ncbi:MAG: hypothetical protein ABI760_11565 [Ferruginibacter sp.]
MESPKTLISSISEESALRDTQVDEYFTDIDPEGYEAADRAVQENPYPGLRPFKTTESVVFFGREGISTELTNRLASCRFLAVLGSSGTGKSSIIRAGLLPVLETLPGKNGAWKVAICRPGKNPFGNLARAIFSAGIAPLSNEMEVWKVLSSSSFGYQRLYDSIKTSETYNTLIVVDQFEELFRYRNDYGVSGRNDAALFVKMLIEASQHEKLNTYVIITMRSEYLGDCVKLPQLVDAINNGQYLVPRLKPSQLIDVITEPATFNNAKVEEGFASKLIGEIGDSMDQLPVLQHVLRRAYEEAAKNPEDGEIILRYKYYVKVGEMESALDMHAMEVYNGLTKKQQEYCKILFQSITDSSTDGRGIRRPLSFLTLLNICREQEANNYSEALVRSDLEMVINSFRKDTVNFLMPPPHVQLSDDLEIDISHESLMRIWKVLQTWMQEEAKDANLLEELLQRDEDEYIKGGKLVIYKEWRQRKQPGKSWATLYKTPDSTVYNYNLKFNSAIALIDKSRTKQKTGIITLFIIVMVILISLGYSYVSSLKKRQVEAKNRQLQTDKLTIDAKNTELRNKQNELAGKNIELARNQEELSVKNEQLTKRERDLEEKNKTITSQAEKLTDENDQKNIALATLSKTRDLLQENNKNLSETQDSLKKVYDSAASLRNLALAIKNSEKSLAIPTYDSQRENVKAYLALKAYLYYLQSGEEENKKFQPQVYSALYDALINKILRDTVNSDAWRVTSYKNGLDKLAYAVIASSQDMHSISYLTAEDKKFYSFDLANKKTNVIDSLTIGNKLVGVETSAGGRWIAVNTLSKKLLLINNFDQRRNTIDLSGIVRSSKFSVDGGTLYTYTQDSVLTTINLANNTRSGNKIKFKIEDIAVSNTHIYGLTTIGDVIEWDRNMATDPGKIISPGNEKSIRGTVINCTPGNDLIVWGNEKGQVFYINKELQKAKEGVQKTQYLARFGGPVTSIAFDNSFRLVAVASYDKTIQVFNLPNLQAEVPLILKNNEGPVTSVFFQTGKTGKERLVAVISPGTLRFYSMDLETLACRLYDFYKDKQPSKEDREKFIGKEEENKKVEIECKPKSIR